MRTVRLLIEYDGADYSGWQAQINGPSVQEEIETAVFKTTGEKVRLNASGRTDAGVHALGQVATFRTESDLSPERIAAALNAHLPQAVAVLAADWAPAVFHPRKSARAKTYMYRILNRKTRPALDAGRVYHFARPLDIEAMRRAAGHLVGRHDFRSFTRPSSERPAGYEREIFNLEVIEHGGEVIIEVTGSGFLHNMVRIIAGTLIAVGRGATSADELPEIITARDREKAGPTAPACGLYLVRVDYGEDGPSA